MIFGLSVVVVHFVAMSWTSFQPSAVMASFSPLIENGTLALFVMISAFVICGTFLLLSTTFVSVALPGRGGAAPGLARVAAQGAGAPQAGFDLMNPASAGGVPEVQAGLIPRIPYERDRRTHFIPANEVVAVRAEGHYTILYTRQEKLFCPWSISEAQERLPAALFLRTHRSYLVNRHQVVAFERHKDSGSCHFEGVQSLKFAPVSRGNVAEVRAALGL